MIFRDYNLEVRGAHETRWLLFPVGFAVDRFRKYSNTGVLGKKRERGGKTLPYFQFKMSLILEDRLLFNI